MVENATGLASLPTELLIQLLTSFSTSTLLPLALVSHRFHDVIIRILHNRLLHAASLEDHKLVLECYHPTSKLTTPYLFCEYLGTDGLSNEVEGEGSLYDDVKNCGRLGKLSSLYSHFKPIIPEENKVKRSHPAGSTPSTWYPGDSAPIVPTDSVPCCTMSLESHELFSQLVVITNMVKVGPKRGLFLSSVTIGEDVIRIWRKWLFDQVNDSASSVNASSSVFMAESFSANGRLDENKTGFLWVDKGKTVGLRFRVFEQKDVRNRPILLGIDEDPPVTCTLHYEELVIRTTQLLLKVEESLVQEGNHEGKAIVIAGSGSWS